jgi:hypothetical protein
MDVSAVQTNSVDFSMTTNSGYVSRAIYVDWNQNGSFLDPGEMVYSSAYPNTSYSSTTVTGTITVPFLAVPGPTRMRVRSGYYYYGMDPCNSLYYGEAEDYTFNVIELTPCTDPSISFPASAAAIGEPDTLCITGTGDLDLDLDTPMPVASGITYQWQSSATGSAPWTNVGPAQNVAGISLTGVNTDIYYHCQVLCSGTVALTSSAAHILIVDPQLVSSSDSFHCGPGQVMLSAVASTNSGIHWYDVADGGVPVGTGSPFVTPFLSQTDTFYVVAGVGGGAPTVTQVGTGTSSTSYYEVGGPFNNYYRNEATQMLYTADEIQAAGGMAGVINTIGFNCTGSNQYALLNYKISIATVAPSITTLTWQPATAFTQVYSAATLTPPTGWVTFDLDNPFSWNGTDNIVIQICFDQTQPSYSSSGGTHEYTTASGKMLVYYNDGVSTACGMTGTTSESYRANVQFGIASGCESEREPVIAYIRPKPQVDLGPDINECIDNGTAVTLDAGVQPNQPTFLWDNNSTSQVRSVNQSGNYYVAVTNQYGCVGSDTVGVVLRKNPVVDLGADTTVCEGVVLTLDAGTDGIQYFWNTGQNAAQITVANSGSYAVLVTNAAGCTKADTINVLMQGQLPTLDGIQTTNNGGYTFTFNALNPQNVVGYKWDFGDGSPYSYAQVPTHTYATDGNYMVRVLVSSICGTAVDSLGAHILGINDLDLGQDELNVYPNPTRDQATIVNKASGVRMESVTVYSLLGRKVYSAKADSPLKHALSLKSLSSGMYTIRIQTNKGMVVRKLELIK